MTYSETSLLSTPKISVKVWILDRCGYYPGCMLECSLSAQICQKQSSTFYYTRESRQNDRNATAECLVGWSKIIGDYFLLLHRISGHMPQKLRSPCRNCPRIFRETIFRELLKNIKCANSIRMLGISWRRGTRGTIYSYQFTERNLPLRGSYH